MKTRGSVRVYNRYRVVCEIVSLNNYIIIHCISLRLNSLLRTYNKSIILRLLGVHYIFFFFLFGTKFIARLFTFSSYILHSFICRK